MSYIEPLKDQVKAALDAAGYDYAEGRAELLTVPGTKKLYPAFDTCFGNNPAAPYVVPAVPLGPGETYDYGASMQSDVNSNLHWTYRLKEHEALLVFGNLPPQAAFIGYETFLFTRYFDRNNPGTMDWLTHATGVQHHLSPVPDNLLYDNAPIANGSLYENNPDRVVLFANGPTINRRTLEGPLGLDFWGKQAIFSTSADANFATTLNEHLGDLSPIHFHSPIGEDVQMGLSDKDDDFWTLMRYAVPANDTAAWDWRNDVDKHLAVFRVTKRDTSEEVDRHPVFVFKDKTANTDERDLAADLQLLADEVGSALQFGTNPEQEICIPLSMPLHAPNTIPMAMSAVGATNDADYRTSAARSFKDGASFAVVGVNHTQTQNSTYVSLGIYDAEKWLGIQAISQAVGFPKPEPLYNSVEGFFSLFGGLPQSLKDIDHTKLYVHVVALSDASLPPQVFTSDYCTIIKKGTGDGELPEGHRIRVTERAYLNPASTSDCGPDYKMLLSNILVSEEVATSPARKRRSRRSSK